MPKTVTVNEADIFPGWPFVGGGAEDDGGSGVDDQGAGGDGGDGGEPAGPVDLLQVAADFDDQAISGEGGGGDADDPDGEGEGSGEGKGAGASAPDPVDEFISKNYGGDRAAFVASLHESRTEARRLLGEIEALKLEIRSKPQTRDTAAELKAAREADADVQALDQEMKDIAADHKAVQQEQLSLATKAQALQTSIASLSAELPHLDDQKEYTKKLTQLHREQLDLNNISSDYKTNELKLRGNERAYRQLQRDLRRADEAVQARLSAREDESRVVASDTARTREHFATAFDIHAKPFGLNPDSDRLKVMREAVRTLLADHLESQPDDADGLDAAGIFKAVGQLVGVYTKANDMKPRAAGASTGRPGSGLKQTPGSRRVVTPTRRPANGSAPSQAQALRRPAPPRTPDDVLSDPELVRKRAEHIFSAASRAGGRRGIA